MTSVSHEPVLVRRERSEWADVLRTRELWAAVAIVAMWLAVLFVGVFGPSIKSTSGVGDIGNGSSVPSVVVVAPCAVLATWLIARHAFRRERKP